MMFALKHMAQWAPYRAVSKLVWLEPLAWSLLGVSLYRGS